MVDLAEIKDFPNEVDSLVRGFSDSFEEELQSLLLVVSLADCLKQSVVSLVVKLEVEAGLQDWLAHNAARAKQEGDRKPA